MDASDGLTVAYFDDILHVAWATDWFPAGYTVQLLLFDGEGGPVADVEITYAASGGSATVTGAGIAAGANLDVSIFARSAQSDTQSITIKNLATSGAPALSNRAGGIMASWDAISEALGYELKVLSATGTPLDPQPGVTYPYEESPTTALVDGTELTDLTDYRVEVRATATGSFSGWSDASTLKFDRSTPDSALLRALLKRLQDAGPQFDLDEAIIQAQPITNLFGRLLGNAGSAISVSGAAVSSTAQDVTLSGVCTLFDVPDVTAQFVFTADDETLILNMSAPLGTRTVQQLYDADILPGSLTPPASWGSNLAALPDVTLELESKAQTVSFSSLAASEPWDILGLPGTSLAPPEAAMSIQAAELPSPVVFTPRFKSKFGSDGAQIPVYIDVPSGDSGWQIGLDMPAPGFEIGSISKLQSVTYGGSNLPPDIVAMNDMWLTSFDIAVTPSSSSPTVWWFDMGVTIGRQDETNERPVWTIIENVLAIHSLSAELAWTLYQPPGEPLPSGSASGTISGTILIGEHPVTAVVDLPVGPNGWQLASAAPIELPGLSDLAKFFSGSNYLEDALAPLGTTQGFALTALGCRFHPPPQASLDQIELELSVTEWDIPAIPWFHVDEIVFALDVVSPLNEAKRSLSAGLFSRLTIGEQIEIDLAGTYQSASGIIDIAWSGQSLDAVPISKFSSIVTEHQISENIPRETPIDGKFLLSKLAVTYDTKNSYMRSLEFEFGSLMSWPIVEDFLVLNSFHVLLNLYQDGPQEPLDVSGTIRAPMTIAGAVFDLQATKPGGVDPWTFSASLAGGLNIEFSNILTDLIGEATVLPAGHNFPQAMNVVAADLTLVPSTQAFHFNGLAVIDWPIQFGHASFAITELAGGIVFPGESAPKEGFVSGRFDFASAQGMAKLSLGTADTPTILTIAISNAPSLSPQDQVDAIAGEGAYNSAPRPNNFPVPTFASAGAVLNLTADSYLVHGQYGGGAEPDLYGGLALLVQRQTEEDAWGYSFAAALNNWNFAKLSEGLAIVDNILSLDSADAAVALSSLDGEAGQVISQYVPGIDKAFEIKKGLNLFGKMDFSKGLVTRVAELLGITTQGPFTLTGYIPADSGESVFTATLGNLTFLDTLSFSDIEFTYKVSEGYNIQLGGKLTVTVGSQELQFVGDMNVNQTAAKFNVSKSGQNIEDPLGLPGVTFGDLGLSLVYTFAVPGEAPASWEMDAHGSTVIGPVSLTGTIAFKDGKSALAAITLSEPVSIDAIFTQMLQSAWPSGLLAITFQDGDIWYAPESVQLNGREWASGFNAQTTVDVYFLTDVKLSVRLVGKTASTPGSAVGTAQYGHAIDWGFVKLYQDAAHPLVGPAIGFDSNQNSFTVQGGFSLFDAAIADLALAVTSKTMKGTATFGQSLGPFGKPTISFTWDNTGFHVDNWPLDGLKLPDFEFSNIKGSGSCSKVVISSLPIESKFTLHPKLSITATPKPALRITLNGSFDLVCNSALYSGTVLTADIVEANLDVELPTDGKFDWDALGASFVKCITDAAQSVFKNLIEDPENLAKLLAVGGIKFAVGELVDYLVCRGATEAEATAFAEGAMGAVASDVAITIGGVTAVIGVGGVVGVIGAGGTFENGGSSNGGGEHKPPPARPAPPALSWSDGLKVEWTSVDNASRYVVRYRGDGGGWDSQETTGTSVTLAVQPGPLFQVEIIAGGPGGVSQPSDASSLQTISAPANLAASYGYPHVSLTWDAVTGADADGYTATAARDGKSLLPPPSISGSSATGVTLTTTAFEAGGQFEFSVTAKSPVMTGPASHTVITIHLLPAPENMDLMSDGQTVSASWAAVSDATDYIISVRDEENKPLIPQPSMQIDAANAKAVISGEPLVDGMTIKIAIAAYGPGKFGHFSAPAELKILWLGAPSFAVAYDEITKQLTVNFLPVASATGYAAEVLDGDGSPLQPPLDEIITTSPGSFDASRLETGSAYLVRLRATAPTSLGAWAEAPRFTLTELGAPSSVEIVNHADALEITYDAVASANLYEAEIFEASGEPLTPPLIVRGSSSPLSIAADQLISGSEYTVRVRAIILSPQQPKHGA